jgi:prepilin-type N-terminal cleavage/methylation domain-containing protein
MSTRRRAAGDARVRARRGFTMLEMTVILVMAGILVSIASAPLASYLERISARRAAEVFGRDLTLARAMSLRGRESVTVKFSETSLLYSVRTASGRVLATRRFGTGGNMKLSSVDLALPGDSIAFSSRGVGGISSSLGTATFTAGTARYRVQFNPMGAAKVTRL